MMMIRMMWMWRKLSYGLLVISEFISELVSCLHRQAAAISRDIPVSSSGILRSRVCTKNGRQSQSVITITSLRKLKINVWINCQLNYKHFTALQHWYYQRNWVSQIERLTLDNKKTQFWLADIFQQLLWKLLQDFVDNSRGKPPHSLYTIHTVHIHNPLKSSFHEQGWKILFFGRNIFAKLFLIPKCYTILETWNQKSFVYIRMTWVW